MRIILVGMPASGKSTLGRDLAQKLNCPFADLDSLICEQEACSIPEIFSQGGEPAFREAEKKALHQALLKTDLVLATGGGTPCFFDNMEVINQGGLSIYLRVPLSVLAERIQEQDSIRPLYSYLNQNELIEKLKDTFQKRDPFYQKAHLFLSHEEEI